MKTNPILKITKHGYNDKIKFNVAVCDGMESIMNKKLLLLVMSVLLCFSLVLTSCGGDEPTIEGCTTHIDEDNNALCDVCGDKIKTETPSEDKPSDDTPTDDTPSDDTPSDDTPSEEKPSGNEGQEPTAETISDVPLYIGIGVATLVLILGCVLVVILKKNLRKG